MRFLALVLAASTALHAANTPERLTAKERAQGYRDRVILVKPRPGAGTEVELAEARENLRLVGHYPRAGGLRAIALAASDSLDAVIARLRQSGRYEYVERDYIRERRSLPNDPRFGSGDQWYLRNTGQQNGVAGADISAAAAWDIRTDASSVTVAIIDTGIRATHEDLAANLWRNPREIPGNHIDDDGNGYVDDVYGINALAAAGSANSGNPDDDFGHGTYVAGLIAGAGNNGKGITGVAQAKIMALKFDDAEGSATSSNMIECVDYAVTNGAKIINISYGGFDYSQAEFEALQRARAAGVIVVVSAGNETLNNDIYQDFPANYLLDNIVAVASTDRSDRLSDFSNYGTGLVELAAPGTDILTTGRLNDTDYSLHSGTSFSAPLVAGALALLKAQFPTETYRGLINRLLRSVDPITSLNGKVQTGGRLNVARALASTSNRPFNDDFSTRAILSGNAFLIRGNTAFATAEPGEPAHALTAASGTLWWSWTAPLSGTAALESAGSDFDTVIGVYIGTTLGSLSPVAANDDSGGKTTSRVAFSAVAGTTYQIALGGKNDATGSVTATLGYLPANDNLSDAILLSGPSTRISGYNFMASAETNEPLPAAGARGRSVWYKWTAPKSDYHTFSIFPFGFDALGGVYTMNGTGGLTLVKPFSTQKANEGASVQTTAGVTYYIQVDTASDAAGYFDLAIIDGLAIPAVLGANSSPAWSPRADFVVMGDDYGFFSAFATTKTDYASFTLTGELDVQTPAMGWDGSVYIGDNIGYLYGYTPHSEAFTRRWRVDLGDTSISSSPALAPDGTIYVHTDDGVLHANLSDGTQRWTASVPGDSYSSPTLANDGTIYLGSSDTNMYALSPTDGSVKWKFKADGEIYASPALDAAGNLYFGTLGGNFYCISPTGQARWLYPVGSPISSSAAIGLGDMIYFGAYDHYLYALTPGGTLQWRYATDDEIRASSPAVAADGTIYIGSYDGYIHAVTLNGVRRRVYATGAYIRSSPLIQDGYLWIGSGDARVYFVDPNTQQANSAWPMHRQNVRRTGGRLVVAAPTWQVQPTPQFVAAGGAATLSTSVQGMDPMTFQWQLNGNPIAGAANPTYALTNFSPAQAGNYTVSVTNDLGSITSSTVIVGLNSNSKLIGQGQEFADIFHAGTGFTYDQILLGGSAASVRADPGQILRLSYVDLNDDIVQVEFSGAGTLSLVLDSSSGPGLPVNYNQNVTYMKGHAGIVLTGADASTNLSVFSVGRANAANQALFKDSVTYDGFANIAFISITSTDGKFGGLRTANASYFATKGLTGLYAPGVEFTGPVFIGNIRAESEATPVLQIGSGSDTRITGGDLFQTNNRPVQVSGLSQLRFVAGSNSHGTISNAQTNRGRLVQNGTDVTNSVVVNPTP